MAAVPCCACLALPTAPHHPTPPNHARRCTTSACCWATAWTPSAPTSPLRRWRRCRCASTAFTFGAAGQAAAAFGFQPSQRLLSSRRNGLQASICSIHCRRTATSPPTCPWRSWPTTTSRWAVGGDGWMLSSGDWQRQWAAQTGSNPPSERCGSARPTALHTAKLCIEYTSALPRPRSRR